MTEGNPETDGEPEGSPGAGTDGEPDGSSGTGTDGEAEGNPGNALADAAAPRAANRPAEETTGEGRSISPRVQILWGVRVLFGAVLVALVAGGLASGWRNLPLWVGPAVGLGVAVLGLAWVHLRYRIWTFQVRPEELYLERGVFTRVRTIAPFVRIQHVDTRRGPGERALGLSTLVVYTAGSRGADVSIPGLEPAEARALQDRLKNLAIESDGGDAV